MSVLWKKFYKVDELQKEIRELKKRVKELEAQIKKMDQKLLPEAKIEEDKHV